MKVALWRFLIGYRVLDIWWVETIKIRRVSKMNQLCTLLIGCSCNTRRYAVCGVCVVYAQPVINGSGNGRDLGKLVCIVVCSTLFKLKQRIPFTFDFTFLLQLNTKR